MVQMNWSLLHNSFLVSALTTLLAGGLGLLVALGLAGIGNQWRRWMFTGAIIALVLPPFLVTNCWLDLLGHNGAWRSWLPLNLYSLGGAVWLLTLLTWPLTTVLVLSAWNQLESPQLESDPALRGSALIRWLLWPMARPAMGQAAVLTFVLSLNNFTVPVLLQIPVFPEDLWLAFTTRLDETGAWAASCPLVIMPLLVLLVLRRTGISWPRTEKVTTARTLRHQLGCGWSWGSQAMSVALLLVSVALPLQQVVGNSRTWSELPNLFRAAPDTIWNSFAFAAISATACMALGLVGSRLRVRFFLWLPFLIPGVLLGRMMLFAFNGTVLYGTAALVIMAFTVRYLALGWNAVAFARQGMDRDLTDAGRLDGACGWTMFRYVEWPQIRPQLAVAWYLTYLLCLWDVETLVLIYPPGGETLALRIFNLLHYGHNAQVNALCITLLTLALAPLGAWIAGKSVRAKAAT
jgi:iron(III) transport system permease protein